MGFPWNEDLLHDTFLFHEFDDITHVIGAHAQFRVVVASLAFNCGWLQGCVEHTHNRATVAVAEPAVSLPVDDRVKMLSR